MGIYIKANGWIETVTPKEKYWTLMELHAFVHGYIEIVRNLRFLIQGDPNELVLIVNGMGWVQGDPDPYNGHASEIAGQPIAGDALLTTLTELGEHAARDAEVQEFRAWEAEQNKEKDDG